MLIGKQGPPVHCLESIPVGLPSPQPVGFFVSLLFFNSVPSGPNLASTNNSSLTTFAVATEELETLIQKGQCDHSPYGQNVIMLLPTIKVTVQPPRKTSVSLPNAITQLRGLFSGIAGFAAVVSREARDAITPWMPESITSHRKHADD